MNYIFTARGLFIDLVPAYVRLLWYEIPNSFRVPCIEVAFDLSSLLRATPLFRAIREGNQKPEVFIWDETLESPEIMFVFSLRSPTPKIIAEVLGRPAYAAAFQKDEYPKVVAFSSANVPGTGLSDFLKYFDQAQQCTLILTESTSKYAEEMDLLSAAVDTVSLGSLRREKLDLASIIG